MTEKPKLITVAEALAGKTGGAKARWWQDDRIF